jgi:hypothetical protein
MRHRVIRRLTRAALLVLLIVTGVSAAPKVGKPVVTLNGNGPIRFSDDGTASFVLRGNATHVGRYTCIGELQFVAGATAGSLSGSGVAEFIAGDGAQLVGLATWRTGADGIGRLGFSWRDSVEFSDGSVVHSTGRFAKNRPAGADTPIQLQHEPRGHVVIAIIAILIGL